MAGKLDGGLVIDIILGPRNGIPYILVMLCTVPAGNGCAAPKGSAHPQYVQSTPKLAPNEETAVANAANPVLDQFTGEWGWDLNFTPGLVARTFAKFVREGNSLTGRVLFGSDGKREVNITHGKIDGDRISLVVRDVNGATGWDITYTYTGILKDGEIIGSVHIQFVNSLGEKDTGDMPWRGVRLPRTMVAEPKSSTRAE